MNRAEIALRRLSNQRIADATLTTSREVVRWLGAVQAQEYLDSLWAVGLRQRNASEAMVERGIAERTVVRTWPMRGTLHFVAAEDVRWMLELLTPRVIARSARRYRELELDGRVFARCRKVLTKALQGRGRLTRTALYQVLEKTGISAAASRGLHILAHLAQQGLICFGGREGKQHTFVLLDEWVPNTPKRTRDESLAKLAARYFASHGPATVSDFAWWSGLTMGDARTGLELARPGLSHATGFAGQTLWFDPSVPVSADAGAVAHLLPPFDEFTVAYRDRSAVLDPAFAKQVNAGGGILNPTIVIGGQVVGTWKRTLTADSVLVTLIPFKRLRRAEKDAAALAARRYGGFLGRSSVVA